MTQKYYETNQPISIGDRVLVTTPHHIDGNDLTGKYGTVVAITDCVGVQFDEPIPGGHNCGRRGKHGFCWYCFPEDLQLVDDEVEFEESAELSEFIQGFMVVKQA